MFKENVNNKGLLSGFVFAVLIFAGVSLPAQNRNNYARPLKIPLVMSSSFCESRPEHFHTGIDIKTQGVIGHKLYAIEDCRLYRIKIKAGGYGNALYLLNSDSTLALYAHLNRFRDDIQKFARRLQYENKSMFLDTILSDTVISFEKGEMIGYAGNSGHSGGPHLHFEIRKMPDERVINPQTFYDFTDNKAPRYRYLAFYDLDGDDKSEAERSSLYSAGSLKNGSVQLRPGQWGVGVEIVDRMDGTWNRYGIIEMILRVDEDTVYHSNIREFQWKDQKYTEAWFDAYYLKTRSIHVQRCFRENGNHADLFDKLKNDGILELKAGDEKWIHISARDGAGNWSDMKFRIQISGEAKPKAPDNELLKAEQPAALPFEAAFLQIPADALYRDAKITIDCQRQESEEIEGWNFNDHYYAFSEPFTLYLDGSALPHSQKDKIVVMRRQNGREDCLTGSWHGAYFAVQSDEGGYYSFAADSVPPRLYGSRMRDSANYSGSGSVRYRVSDNLSGIETYNAWVDNQWVLLQYKPKSRTLFYEFDEHITPGKWHDWKIRVSDAVGNVREEQAVFYY